MKDDKRHGYGMCKNANGSLYQGEWKDGVRHGCGACKHASGRFYKGEWNDDQMHGQCTQVHPAGLVYVGEFQHNNCLLAAGVVGIITTWVWEQALLLG
ncbi:hypothetical protein ACHAXA_004504 [Cyclostephanos tholiformis]|uniref:MORN repeat-containing protein 3 n=1 Tax=Cyclostephanos tholiformis TaxID=382380 RepID=A0ABD3RDV5_9STRA